MNNLDYLKGKTILIGKEPINKRLCISVMLNGQPQTTAIGFMNSVPDSVSRCKPAEGAAHCKIFVDSQGIITVTNMKPQNVTYVNGVEIMSKAVTESAKIELGMDRYPVEVKTVLESAAKLLATKMPPVPKECSIRHLEGVWKEYKENLHKISDKQANLVLWARIPMLFTMSGAILSAFDEAIRSYALVFTGIALAVSLIGLYLQKTFKPDLEREKLSDELMKKYVCPNEACRHYMGQQPYKILRQNKKCPYCGCLFNEK